MISIHPIKISGNWFDGFVLDLQTISSELLGYNEYGHEVFDTKRSELGELLYRLKYKSDKSVIPLILDATIQFIGNRWEIDKSLDYIIPVPPSKIDRAFQPVMEIAAGISSILNIPILKDCVIKIKETPELKDIFDLNTRTKLLGNAFKVDSSIIKGKKILLFDDLYRSGATFGAITRVLYECGNANKVYVLALTKTRKLT